MKKHKKIGLVSLILLVILLFSSTVLATNVIIESTDDNYDAYIQYISGSYDSVGTDKIIVGTAGVNTYKGYINFDLSAIPSDAIIN